MRQPQGCLQGLHVSINTGAGERLKRPFSWWPKSLEVGRRTLLER
ncbi:hypothetical protein D187_003996 [Cystobacter fuscus DSM 2262]|uniref:Uncharacterized protein n=1 Tax=Cystobacter fuscus (strain ATCC 25194 / DSM 2262 / NBRC 100088 / M29) TaxID=1242864 RepID=S9QB24_CYSF2|nr:hypothetical protein D187_003996 [Cystobacter fuscus DSM 2262]